MLIFEEVDAVFMKLCSVDTKALRSGMSSATVAAMNHYYAAIAQFAKTLHNLDAWVDKAVAHAESKKFDPSVFLTSRLYPDQYHLIRQIQAGCDAAKFAAARLSGQQPPAHPDTETTLPEIKARIATVVKYLESFKESDFEGAEKRIVPLGWAPGKGLEAVPYTWTLAIPNFYFHMTTAYAILRHNGVELGKADFIGDMPFVDVLYFARLCRSHPHRVIKMPPDLAKGIVLRCWRVFLPPFLASKTIRRRTTQ